MRFSFPATVYSAALFGVASAHMELQQPLPMRSPLDPLVPSNDVDYNLKSPLNADGSNFPCRGYQNDRPIRTTATYSPGQQYTMTVTGSATHGGGSCQISLSYDNGNTFKVIKSIVGACPLTPSYNFVIPSFAPAGDVLFAWTWFNEIGNREMYMSCAWVNIAAPAKIKRSSRLDRLQQRAQFASIDSLPNIWRANIAGLDNCTTTEGQDVVFPSVGPSVEYGGSMTASSAATLPNNNCDSAAPAGQLFKQLAVGVSSASAAASRAATTSPSAPSGTASKAIVQSVAPGVFAQGASPLSSPSAAASSSASTVLQLAPSVATSPIPVSVLRNATATPIAAFPLLNTTTTTTTTATTTNSTNSTSTLDNVFLFNTTSPSNETAANGTSLFNASNTTDLSAANTTSNNNVAIPSDTSITTSNTSSLANTTDNAVTSIQLNPSFSTSNNLDSNSAPKTLAFAGTRAADYLPCVPGAFLCVSSTSFLICDQAPGVASLTPHTEFKGPINVAAGMECLPFLQTFPDQDTAAKFVTGQNVKSGLVPAGSFRSDRYVRAGTIAR